MKHILILFFKFLSVQGLIHRTSIKATLNDVPREIVKKTLYTGPLGKTWSIIDVMDNIKDHNIDGVSFATKHDAIKGIIAIDANHLDYVDSVNLHPVSAVGSNSLSNVLIVC